jgi:BirA family transcriptional regulator, biotin operon repressor / biotin---[acetyl-CoA-carboxylase] ligase
VDINEKLVRIFHETGDKHLSGEELAGKLAVSRTTIWNHIHYLIEQGYEFDASTNLGYRLTSVPDRMLPDEISFGLATKWLGHKIVSYEEADSTNDIARKLADEGAKEGTAVFTEHQRSGRGRLHRKWHSPKRKDILLSFILRPDIHPRKATRLTITSALAAAEAIKTLYHLPALIKWPNDIYINGRKCAGILIEMNAELDKINHIVVGIGVNVNSREADFPKAIRDTATSLCIELSRKCDRLEFARVLLRQFEKHFDRLFDGGFDEIRKEWMDLSLTLGRRIRISSESETVEGMPVRLDEEGALLVRTDTGIVRRISGGDVILN